MARNAKFRREREYKSVVPGGRIELPTPAFSGPRSTDELPRHRKLLNCKGEEQASQRRAAHFIESSNSRIQFFGLSTSRAFAPSGGPTMPSFSIMSISL